MGRGEEEGEVEAVAGDLLRIRWEAFAGDLTEGRGGDEGREEGRGKEMEGGGETDDGW